MGSGAASIHEIPRVAGVRVVFNGFRKIAYSPGFHGEASVEIGLRTIGVISLTTDAEKLSATAYSGESFKSSLSSRPSADSPANLPLTLDPATRTGWVV
jgi:hypothetical protein